MGFSTISKPTSYEAILTKDFVINQERLTLSNKLFQEGGEILSALQIEFKTLEPDHSFQTALTISGGLSKKELIDNITKGKKFAMKQLSQVNRSVKSDQRNIQEAGFIKINQQLAQDCNE